MTTISTAVAGFAAVSGVLLFITYAFFIDAPGKSAISIASCGVMLGALTVIEIYQLLYFQGAADPLGRPAYRLALFVAPFAFYFFGRWAILPREQFRPFMLLHLLVIPILLSIRLEIALPILFLFGTGYSVWLVNIVYTLRSERRHFRFEFFFLGIMAALAVLVLILGFALPYIDPAYFYHFYCHAIALAFAIMIVALITHPELLTELTEAARVRYGVSTLREVDVEACLEKLSALMAESRIYQNEDLSLSSLAGEIGISSHQLSELVNTRLGIGFSRYVREQRVEAAKALLVSAPSQSILSIGLDAGFRSQSTFYAAFKEVTGQSPGDYRKSQAKDS